MNNKIEAYANRGSHIIIYSTLFFIFVIMSFYVIPWYSQELPLSVKKNIYYPGEKVCLTITRTALIDLRGQVTKELIRVDDEGVYHEEAKTSFWIDLERGHRKVRVQYKLPESCFELTQRQQTLPTKYFKSEPCITYENNTYKWVGNIVYRPFGLIERTFHFESEKFQIRTGRKE